MTKGETPDFLGRVRGFIRERELISPGEKAVVAVSGGADSVCLLHVLSRLRRELEIELHVAHLNHGLRPDARADAGYVRRLARRLGLPVTVAVRDVRAYQRQRRLSLEEAARLVRYEFLAGVARDVGAARVAVGHTADDHAETVLLHILRGSGTRGLRGLLPLSRLRTGAGEITVIRPLLEMRRRDTIAYCQSQHLRPRVDTTNTSPEFLRNRIRHELIPVLERYNPEVVSALLRTASIARSDYDFIESELDRRWEGTVFLQDGAAVIDRKGFSGLPETLRRYLLCRAIERVRGDLRDIEASHIEDLLEMAEKPAGKTLELPGGLRFITGHDRYTLAPEKHLPSPLPPLEGEAPLNVPGKTLYCGWEITAEVMPRGRVDDVFTADGLTALLDADRLSCPLTVRPRRPGDRFQPLGTEGSKKVSRFMADAHVPRHLRGVVPLLAAPQGIVWVVGYRIDGRFRLTDGTLKVLRVTFRRI